MKQETLEEVASRLLYNKYPYHPPQDSGYLKDMFIEGAKWQQERMYSEEEVLNIQEKYDEYIQKNFDPEFSTLPFKVFFEQFKKK